MDPDFGSHSSNQDRRTDGRTDGGDKTRPTEDTSNVVPFITHGQAAGCREGECRSRGETKRGGELGGLKVQVGRGSGGGMVVMCVCVCVCVCLTLSLMEWLVWWR